jgi:hypothetical protein
LHSSPDRDASTASEQRTPVLLFLRKKKGPTLAVTVAAATTAMKGCERDQDAGAHRLDELGGDLAG